MGTPHPQPVDLAFTATELASKPLVIAGVPMDGWLQGFGV
jgi:hypothetical protein